MGRDIDAVTVIGVQIPIERLGVKSDCDKCDGEFLSCSDCLSKLSEEVRNEIDTSCRCCHLGPYEIYQERYGDDFTTKDYIYICIYKGEKSVPENEVVFFHSLEDLIIEREKLKEYLSRLNIIDDFSSSFGIFTLLYMSY
jgi:hypothetical protein